MAGLPVARFWSYWLCTPFERRPNALRGGFKYCGSRRESSNRSVSVGGDRRMLNHVALSIDRGLRGLVMIMDLDHREAHRQRMFTYAYAQPQCKSCEICASPAEPAESPPWVVRLPIVRQWTRHTPPREEIPCTTRSTRRASPRHARARCNAPQSMLRVRCAR